MFFFEVFAIAIVFPLCWWLGGRIHQRHQRAKSAEQDAAPDLGSNVIDLMAYKRRRDARAARERARTRPTPRPERGRQRWPSPPIRNRSPRDSRPLSR